MNRAMERDLRRWVVGFLRTQKATSIGVGDALINRICGAIPPSHPDFHIHKAALLNILRQHLSTADINEEMLYKLEVFEELHRRFGFPLSPALPAAYCAVAVECTLKYLDLEPSPSNNPAYLSAVDRIWRGRFPRIESGSMLLSEESKRWSSDIEASFKDPQVGDRLGSMNSRRYAIQKLKLLLDEAQDDLGPSFLEIAASMPIASDTAAKDSSTSLQKVLALKETYREPPTENKIVTAPIENQCADALIENEIRDTPIENRSEPVTVENQDKVSPDEDQSPHDAIENEGEHIDPHEQPVGLAKTTDACPSKVHHVSLMERNNTARTDEWDKSTYELEEEISNHACRVQLPSPKRSKRSPLKTYEPPKIARRRKVKKWTTLEEETLRAAVKKIGEGNWKSILDSHKDIFDERTQVDLKDKWRNLRRYGAN